MRGPPFLHPIQVLLTFELVSVLGFSEPFLLGRLPAGLGAGRPRAIALALVHTWISAKAMTAMFTFSIGLFFVF